ncbi:MAG: hypothetical protein MUF73_01235 [Rhodobacteraceae bacterium]|jgi:hypothetical protein|nr:hypothetical protein [Paracoccaceae bacterium]
MTTITRLLPWAGLVLIAAGMVALAVWWWTRPPAPLTRAEADALYAAPLPEPEGPLNVYFVGHSLVGKQIPHMLAQLAPGGHDYRMQTGWGAGLMPNWNHPNPPVNGHDVENAHDRFRPAAEAIDSGEYDAVIVTESVDLHDAIRYGDSPEYLARFSMRARAARPDVRFYLYEVWHGFDVEDGWLNRVDRDLPELWEGVILFGALARDPERRPIHLIPGGQVLAEIVRRIEADPTAYPGLTRPEDLFYRSPEGVQDLIHLSDLGSYAIALTFYAVLYQQSPIGLPHQLLQTDGTPANAPTPEAARMMQQAVWDVVTRLPRTGVPAAFAAD